MCKEIFEKSKKRNSTLLGIVVHQDIDVWGLPRGSSQAGLHGELKPVWLYNETVFTKNIEPLFYPGMLLLGIFLSRLKYTYYNTCLPIFLAVQCTISKLRKHPACSFTNEHIKANEYPQCNSNMFCILVLCKSILGKTYIDIQLR